LLGVTIPPVITQYLTNM